MLTKEETELHQRLGAVIALDIVKEQLEAVQTIYDERRTKDKDAYIRKRSQNRYNKCRKAIESNQGVVNDIYSDLLGNQDKAFIHDAILHHQNLFYDLISLEYNDQERVKGLIKKLKKT